MKLSELTIYNPITIQCHDNPDADAIASGYGLYCYFKRKGKDVRLIYSGPNVIQKSNLTLMIDKLNLPIEYVKPLRSEPIQVDGLLVTVDCQYGAGNVTRILADQVAIIDHHQVEITEVELSRIQSNLGSCSTLVWEMLMREGYPVNEDPTLGTALYYGLYTDTSQFSEIYNPLDMDMREMVSYNKSLITLFRNSNLSLKELEIAGIAMIRYSYNEDYKFAVIKAQPCDPNILGLISDFLLQVDQILACVVFNEVNDGYKFSVRSCVKEVNASELASYLAGKIGSGGGHYEKAGGFISSKLYEKEHPSLHAEAYFNNRMTKYFDEHEIIYAKDYEMKVDQMKIYREKQVPIGYVKAGEILPNGTPITIRTLKGDLDMVVSEELFFIIGLKGEVSPIRKEDFEHSYLLLDKKYTMEDYSLRYEYVPTIKDRDDGTNLQLIDYAKVCVPTGEVKVYAKSLEKRVKIFTIWDEERYMLGRKGDYLAVNCSDKQDIFVVEKDIFEKSYEEISLHAFH